LAKSEVENRYLKEENKRLMEDNFRLRQRPEPKHSSIVDRTEEEEKKQDDDYQLDFEEYDEELPDHNIEEDDQHQCQNIENVESIEEVIEEEEDLPQVFESKENGLLSLSRLLGLDINHDLIALLGGL
jgi:hypothetical protein